MPSLNDHFTAMAYNNAWANHRLLKACGHLSAEEFTATRTSFFPSISATLNHNLTVDWYYVEAIERSLRGAPLDPDGRRFFDVEAPFPACPDLATAQRAVDRRLVAVCLAGPDLDRHVGVPRSAGRVQDEPLHRLLGHLFQHQIHHRGQAHAMLAGTAVSPPQLDELFCTTDAPLRAADLAELGWDEATVWP